MEDVGMRKRWTAAVIAALVAVSTAATTVKADDTSTTANTNEMQVTATSDQTNSDSDKVTYNKADYLSANPKLVRVKHATTAYKDAALTKSAQSVKAGSHFLISRIVKSDNQVPILKTSDGLYLPAKKSLVTKVIAYQNPKGYHQVHYTQVKPYGKVGYNLYRGYEGIKTWKVMHRVGTWAGTNYYNQATYNAVKNFQRSHHLPATGNVNLATWEKMGFSKKSWYSIDSYVAPLKAYAWQGRKAHIEAMINQAYKYMGKPWLAGCSTSPSYGVDCSGLVMQGLYAGGISPVPTSSIGHAHPGNEWNSRNLWADKHLKRVPYSQRQRGDLVFYYQPGTHTIWHVAIYLGNNRVIESWPPRVMVQPIVNSQRNVIAGIKRPFI